MATKKSTKLKHSDGEARSSREMDDRPISEDRELTDQERLDEFRMTSFQSILPDIPPIDGYHVCWLTTENPRDPIHSRMRLGYTPVKPEDIPGFGEHMALKSGEWQGCIGVNEMLAFKLPLNLYNAFMKHNHYDAPKAEEEALSMAARIAGEVASEFSGGHDVSFELAPGQESIGENIPSSPQEWEG